MTSPQNTTDPHSLTTVIGPAVEAHEEYDDDCDSAVGDSTASSSTTSLASSILSYTYENGRRYHSDHYKNASYFMPNDESEQDRLDLYHFLFLKFLGGELYSAPLKKGSVHHVLDVGTGTGIWAIDFADAHPEAEVRATDLSPIQPSWVPPNVKFEVDDSEEEWTYKKLFDYIHFRTMCGCFRDWNEMLKKSYDNLNPGGWVEFQDYSAELFNYDGTLLSGPERFPNGLVEPYDPKVADTSALAYIFHLIAKGSEVAGRPTNVARTMDQNMIKAGFEDVTVKKKLWPLGGWPKDKDLREFGNISHIGLADGLHAFCAALLTRYLGWEPEDVNVLVEKGRKDMARGKYYSEGWFIIGRKPL